MTTLVLSLVSHTNAGKTTLARTLLGRDIGEVRDGPHVTEFADGYTLQETPEGDQLQLWDTPGFGDSVRLVKRLRQADSPLGWFLSAVWDRWSDRPFWASQQALRHVRDRSSVVLYLVNAGEEPAAAGYVKPEMELLAWVGKPVLVLLNQLGAPRGGDADDAEVQRWRDFLVPFAPVSAVLPLDAFARCWVQELALLQAVEKAVEQAVDQALQAPPQTPAGSPDRAAMSRLRQAWLARRLATFDASVQALAGSLGRIGAARAAGAEGTAPAGWLDRLRRLGSLPSGVGSGAGADADPAQAALALALDEEVRRSTGELIALHGLDGRAQGEVLALLAGEVETRERVPEGRAAMLGGAVTGALAGLKADLASGGLTLGGGLIAGGLLGALGAAGLARAVNVVRDTERRWVHWRAEAMAPRIESALLRYLAVAHFGRGRGEWQSGEAPAHWREAVKAVLAAQASDWAALWAGRSTRWDNAGEAERLALGAQPLLAVAARALLQRLYPQAWAGVVQGGLEASTAGTAEPAELAAHNRAA